jgi:hypothetical protein
MFASRETSRDYDRDYWEGDYVNVCEFCHRPLADLFVVARTSSGAYENFCCEQCVRDASNYYPAKGTSHV